MATGRLERVGAAVEEQPLVVEVRTGPDPQVAGLGGTLVGEEDGGEQRERRRRIGPGPVPVDVGAARYVVKGRHGRGDLDVVEGVVERRRGDELLGDPEGRRVAQDRVAARQPSSGREPEVRSGSTGALGRRHVVEQAVDLRVGGRQQRLRHDVGDDEVAVAGEAAEILLDEPVHDCSVARPRRGGRVEFPHRTRTDGHRDCGCLGCRLVVATGSSSPGSPRAGVLAAIGNTPAVQLVHLVEPDMAEVWVKLEAANPTGSYKDRMALAMIEGAERSGRLRPGQPVVEYTGGSTGSSLAFICAVTGHPLHIVTSDAFADEKRRTMEAFGAHVEIVASPAGITPDLIPRMRTRAKELADALDAYQTDQFANTDMVDGYRQLGNEVAAQVPGAIDALCLYVGTAGCFLGVSQALRRHHPALTRIAVEPAESAVLSGGSPGTHRIEGGGVGFRPDLLGADDIDEVIPVSTADAFAMARARHSDRRAVLRALHGRQPRRGLGRCPPARSWSPRRHHPGRLRPEVPRRAALPVSWLSLS